MKAKKGSKAYKAKLSAAQKRSWAKRRREAKLAFEEVPRQQWHEGTSSHRWSAEAGCQQSNIPKEDTEQYFVKPGDWRLDNGGDPSAKPFNPDAMFQQPPIHPDPVNHPAHYLQHPSGVECITITEHFNFNRGNAIKYIWRAGEKSSVSLLEDLRKAQWYLNREISRLEKEAIR